MEALQFKLEQFEGPLDLLLHLIAKHKLDIHDIAITVLLEQYLDYMEQMKLADWEVTSDFLAMAAHLVYIKTVSLLPRHEEAEQLKEQLQEQLLEYRLYQQAAMRLREGYCADDLFLREPMLLTPERKYLCSHAPSVLREAYELALGKGRRSLPPPPTAFSGIVSRRMVSVSSRVMMILERLYRFEKVPYGSFFASDDRSELVATFLAMLELLKSKRIVLCDDDRYVVFQKVGQVPDTQPETDTYD